jgi:hypothetical protein
MNRLLYFLIIATAVLPSLVSMDAHSDVASGEAHMRRVGDYGMTFLLDGEFLPCRVDTVEEKRIEWKSDSARVEYARSWDSPWRSVVEEGDSFCGEPFRTDGVKLSFDTERAGITIFIKPPEAFGHETISISSASKAQSCRIAQEILASVRHTNTVDGIEVLHIAPDRSFVVVRNEVGAVRALVVGDRMTRNLGDVVEIGPRYVKLLEARPGKQGDLVQVPVTINWRRTDGKK